MGRVADYRAELSNLDRRRWPAFLDEHSGLPGPRGNIELALTVADLGDDDLFDELIASDDEYRTFCGVVGLGARAAEPQVTDRLHAIASDERWRVREAVAMALQRLGDVDLPATQSIALAWATDEDPLVQRAAAAGICEPRLLATSEAAAVGVEVCRRATLALVGRPAEQRRDPQVRTLRQALGYCWSVAVAADPVPGLAAFRALDDTDPDVAWIVRTNLAKKRLSRLVWPSGRPQALSRR
jgi:hypothetical protein